MLELSDIIDMSCYITAPLNIKEMLIEISVLCDHTQHLLKDIRYFSIELPALYKVICNYGATNNLHW